MPPDDGEGKAGPHRLKHLAHPLHLQVAPRNICDMDPAKRREGIQVAKNWLDGAAILGAKSMCVNSGGPRIAPEAVMKPRSYPKNDKLAEYLRNCIESFKEMADYGAKRGVKVTLENHWGLTRQSHEHPYHRRRGEQSLL
jgi:sugar phosphate isomerase/epimerase